MTTIVKKQDKKGKTGSQAERKLTPSTKLAQAEAYLNKFGFPRLAKPKLTSQ